MHKTLLGRCLIAGQQQRQQVQMGHVVPEDATEVRGRRVWGELVLCHLICAEHLLVCLQLIDSRPSSVENDSRPHFAEFFLAGWFLVTRTRL
jgi:hypothetical protein